MRGAESGAIKIAIYRQGELSTDLSRSDLQPAIWPFTNVVQLGTESVLVIRPDSGTQSITKDGLQLLLLRQLRRKEASAEERPGAGRGQGEASGR